MIAPNKLVTVAHKFYVETRSETTDLRAQAAEFIVRCGEHNVKAKHELGLLESQETAVRKIEIHPDYDARRVRYNLAVLLTNENFVYAAHIGPVCLPRPGQSFAGKRECFSSGWGSDAYDSNGLYSDTLKRVQMPIVEKAECEAKFTAHPRAKGRQFRIHESWLCVGGEPGSDTCKGDGGSPHVCKDEDGRFVQVGAVAWGWGCGDDVPSVYSHISQVTTYVFDLIEPI